MKLFKSVVAISFLSLFAGAGAFAKAPKLTLADLNGAYTGTATLSNAMFTGSGPLSLTFRANKAGKTAAIQVAGQITVGNQIIPVTGNVTLGKRSFVVDNFVFNTLAKGPLPGNGSYKLGKNGITFQAIGSAEGEAFPFSGTITTKTKGRKQTLVYTTTVPVSTVVYVFSFTCTQTLKKSH